MLKIKTLTLAVALLATAGLAGCSTAQQAAIDLGLAQSEAGIKAFNDREALALKQAPCAMRVGAANRVLTPAEWNAVQTLCGGEPGLTFADLAAMGRAIELLQRGEPKTLDGLVPKPAGPVE